MFLLYYFRFVFFFFQQKTAYDMRISDWSSDVCSSDLGGLGGDPWREDAGGAGAAVRRSSEPDHGLAGAASRRCRRGVREQCGRRAGGGGREGASRQDRAADAGERFFVRCARQGRHDERKAMIDREHELDRKSTRLNSS